MTTGTPTLESVLTCPHCGHARPETMPTDCLPVLLRVRTVQGVAAAEGGRLLRVLLLRIGQVPACANAARMLQLQCVMEAGQLHRQFRLPLLFAPWRRVR